MLLGMRSQTLMVRSRALRGVSNHEATGRSDNDSSEPEPALDGQNMNIA